MRKPASEAIRLIETQFDSDMAERKTRIEGKVADLEKKPGHRGRGQPARGAAFDAERARMEDELPSKIEQLKDLRKGTLLTENQYQEIKTSYGQVFEAGMGAEAILKLLGAIELDDVRSQLDPGDAFLLRPAAPQGRQAITAGGGFPPLVQQTCLDGDDRSACVAPRPAPDGAA